MRVRLATQADLPDLMRLKSAAGWNQTENDWLRLLRLQPDGCFVVETADGAVAASATALIYPGELAWVGMVLTLPEYRGRGFARRLMDAALEFCGGTPVGLDASDMGQPLYASLGFRGECAVERWMRQPGKCEARQVNRLDLDPVLDREVFGADRTALLAELAAEETGSAGEGSYAFGRPGSDAAYFGPCVCHNSEAAEALLRWFVSRHEGERVYLDLLPETGQAARIAQSLGFAPVRRLVRMVRYPAARVSPDHRIFAIAGFEYG
jgi:GNAT superfamily N-acetyltransferase